MWLLAGLVACGKDTPTSNATPNPPTTQNDTVALRGGDISALARMEQAGGVYRSNGTPGDAIAILRAQGSNTFRLRLFVQPNGQEVQVNDLPYTVALAKRIKAAGAKLVLDLHYSDTWADPAHQTLPAAWANLSASALETQIESYSADVMSQLRAAGALPDIVQVGNEIDAGMLWPIGRVGGTYDRETQWVELGRLLNAAIRGIKSPLQAGEAVRIMLHYSQGGSTAGTQWFFSHIQAQGVPYDIIGLSYYPWWHGPLSDLQSNLSATAMAFQKDIIIAETEYPWRSGGWEEMTSNRAAMTWAISPTGQSDFLQDLVNTVAATPGKHGLGVLWWYPEAISVSGLFVYGGGSLGLFDASGNVLPAAGVF